MFRHGVLLRLGILTNNQIFGTFVKPNNLKYHVNIIDSVLKHKFPFTSRSFSKVAVTEDVNTAEIEVATTEAVKTKNDATVNSTLSQMIIDDSKHEDDDVESNSHQGKKIWTNQQEKILYTDIEQGKTFSAIEWATLREKTLSAGRVITQHNIDASIIGLCISFKHLATGRSYLSYLLESGQEPNVASIAKFFRLCFTCCDEVDEDVRQLIESLYDTLRAKHSVFDASTAEHVIQGLAVTQRWKEGLELLNDIKLTCSPNAFTYSTLVKAAFDNNETEFGWEMITKMLEDNRKPMLFVYEAWLKYAHRFASSDSKLEEKLVNKLLNFFSTNDIRLSEELVKMIRLWFEYSAPLESNWNAEFTTVDPRGMCKSCHQHLRPIALTVDEFDLLRSAFMSKAVVGSNVFLKSTPEELARYQEFVSKTAPYDIVIDGLNVSYSAGAAGKGNPRSYARILQAVVAHFVDNDQKVLVLGREHMNTWPRYHMNYVRENAHVFLAENLSQDDPFLLYAAMYSGLGTCFISRDLMRSHAFILRDTRLQGLFTRWQKQHQYQVLYVGEGGNVRLKHPLKYNTSTQKSRRGGWHIPYDLDNITPRAQALNPPFQWLCLSQYSDADYDESSRYQDRDESPRYQGRDDQRSFGGNRRSFDSNSRRDDFGSSFEGNRTFKPRQPRRESFDDSAANLSRPDAGDSKRKPQRKWFDEDSDDEDSVPQRNTAVESKKPFETYRKAQQVWSDDDSEDDRPPTNRQPQRNRVTKTNTD